MRNEVSSEPQTDPAMPLSTEGTHHTNALPNDPLMGIDRRPGRIGAKTKAAEDIQGGANGAVWHHLRHFSQILKLKTTPGQLLRVLANVNQ